jgi:hypothetical protein
MNMDSSTSNKYLAWERRQHQDEARRRLDFRRVVKHFVLVFSLVATTVAFATMLPR